MSERLDWKQLDALTIERFDDPKPGYSFHEMFSFWLLVMEVEENFVVWLQFSGPCTIPRDGKIMVDTHAGFRKHFAYSHGKGYSVTTIEQIRGIEGWADFRRKDINDAKTMMHLPLEAGAGI